MGGGGGEHPVGVMQSHMLDDIAAHTWWDNTLKRFRNINIGKFM